jgi:hypothetical protein
MDGINRGAKIAQDGQSAMEGGKFEVCPAVSRKKFEMTNANSGAYAAQYFVGGVRVLPQIFRFLF